MNLEQYPFVSKSNHLSFSFNSKGPKGIIKKVVLFRQLYRNENIYNLGFGDWDEIKHGINDRVISNNKDTEKVLATVSSAVLEFSRHYPKAIIYVKGSTPSRTRLYQMGVGNYFKRIKELYVIYGFRNEAWEKFSPGRNYHAFSITCK
jgi:hypothetical protein